MNTLNHICQIIKNTFYSVLKLVLKINLNRVLCLGGKINMPQRQIMMAYFTYTLVGTLLLMMPFSTTTNVSFVDNLFNAVSAISTTGLTSISISTKYTFWGQFVLLCLIQIGGLGYMTISAYIMLHITHALGNEKAKLFSIQFAYPDTIQSESMLRSIVNFTLGFELLGVTLLLPYFYLTGVEQPLWSAVYHVISAFCTAGFSIYPDNLIRFQADVYVNVVLMFLCFAGAMGFIVMTDIYRKITRRKYQISFTSKVICVITGMLALWGTLHLFLFEPSLQKLDAFDRLLVSLFQAMSAMTTVGYNTIELSGIAPVSLMVLSVCMYIGASPSGTGGGLKSTTLSALYAYTKNKLGLHKNVSICGNIIPDYRIETAVTTFIFYSFILFLGVYSMTLFEPNDADFLKIFFEASSALATAGLSCGVVSSSTLGSKLTLIILMYIGRVGVITLGNALLASKKNKLKGKTDMAV